MPRPGRRLSTAAPCRIGRPATGAGAAVLVASLLAGCGPEWAQADPSPAAATTPVVTSTAPAATPTATDGPYDAPADAYVKPARPAVLDGQPSEAAAIAFAKYYLRLYTYAYLTGDAADLNELGKAGCIYCENVAADLSREYGAGGHDEGGAISIERASAHDFGVNGLFKTVLFGQQAPGRELDARGAVVEQFPRPQGYEFDFALSWTAKHGWRVAQLAAVEQ